MESPFFRSDTAQLFLRPCLFLLYLKSYHDTIDFNICFHPKIKTMPVSKTALVQDMVLNQLKR